MEGKVVQSSTFRNFDLHKRAVTDRDFLEQESFTWDLLFFLENGRSQKLNDEWKVFSYERNLCILQWLENVGKEKAKLYSKDAAETSLYPYDSLCEKQSGFNVTGSSKEDFLKLLWICIRSGDKNAAEQFCNSCNQFWRFGSLQGSGFTQKDGENANWNGNPHRNLWKYCCWQLSNQPSFSEYERALYAYCCGNLLQMFKVCDTWQDYLWACFRVLIDANDDVSILFLNNVNYFK